MYLLLLIPLSETFYSYSQAMVVWSFVGFKQAVLFLLENGLSLGLHLNDVVLFWFQCHVCIYVCMYFSPPAAAPPIAYIERIVKCNDVRPILA